MPSMLKVQKGGLAAVMCESKTQTFASIQPSPLPSEDAKMKDMAIVGTFAFASAVAMFGWISALGWLAYKLTLG
jgi:hypothetical protein